VVVPKESEPPHVRDKSPQSIQAESGSWKGPVLAGLIPSAFLCLELIPFVAVLLVVVAPLVANPLLGMIVGRSASRRRFVYGMGVAIGGWILSGVVGALVFGEIAPMFTGPIPKGSETGWGMFMGLYVMFGVLTSPIAGIASVLVQSRRAPSGPLGPR